MNVNRSGYYKWLQRKDNPSRYESNRLYLLTKIKGLIKRMGITL